MRRRGEYYEFFKMHDVEYAAPCGAFFDGSDALQWPADYAHIIPALVPS